MENNMRNESILKEIEILEFRAGGSSYGIDVNDISEILAYNTKPTPVPNAHRFIEGILMPRDFVITVIDFKQCVPVHGTEEKNEMIINTRFQNYNIAIHVDSVNGINKYETADIIAYQEEEHSEYTNAYLDLENRRIEMVDYQKLYLSINPDLKFE